MTPMSDTDTPDLPQDTLDAAERDENTNDMFGDFAPDESVPKAEAMAQADEAPTPSVGEAYTVLARKYRPRTFEDLIGQEAMVRTLTNAFALNRIAHAFMLTGVRGVGKTTTARLLARALNFESDTQKAPSIDLTALGFHCQSIIDGRHIDVLELDAASRTGVDAMRELLESVRYPPLEARFKVYVIDEVHMLSTGAFNALLKTLEEPPSHVKFIFATTEIRKVPVTILSRCQRFDLRRVEPDILGPHLEKICRLEKVALEKEAVALIARAAEGSVRDGLSLLDQALVQSQNAQSIGPELVRDMLGLVDAEASLSLYETVIKGDIAAALMAYRTLYGFGADPSQIMGDLMDYCHASSVAKLLGAEQTRLPKSASLKVTAIGTTASVGTLSRLWSLMLKAFEEIRRAPDPNMAMEMALVRLCYISELPGPEHLLKQLEMSELSSGPNATSGRRDAGQSPSNQVMSGRGGPAQARSVPQSSSAHPQQSHEPLAQLTLNRFEDVIALIDQKRDIGLKHDVERYVRLIRFQPGAITFEPAPNTPPDLVRKLSARLMQWTGQRWLIATEGGQGALSVIESQARQRDDARSAALNDPFVLKLMQTFPGAELTRVMPRLMPMAPKISDDTGELSTLEMDDD